MTEKDLLKIINNYEDHEKLKNIMINDIHIWPLIRLFMYMNIEGDFENKSQNCSNEYETNYIDQIKYYTNKFSLELKNIFSQRKT